MTREEAIQILQTALTAPFIYGEYADAIGMAIEALSAEAVQGWIPVSEELPEKDKEVLISLEWGIDIGQYDGDWRSEWINHYDDDHVLAWMPLPKLYKGGNSE